MRCYKQLSCKEIKRNLQLECMYLQELCLHRGVQKVSWQNRFSLKFEKNKNAA